jgi:hypothetical protein
MAPHVCTNEVRVRAAGLGRQTSDQRTRLRTAGSAGKGERYWDLNRRNPINHSAATTVWIFLATHVRRCLIGRQPDNPEAHQRLGDPLCRMPADRFGPDRGVPPIGPICRQ